MPLSGQLSPERPDSAAPKGPEGPAAYPLYLCRFF